MRGKNQEENKKINKNLILKLLITNKNLSRITLSQLTGLTKMAVSNIVSELIEEGSVTELGIGDTSIGRKPVLLQIVPHSRIFAGMYISRINIMSFLGDITGEIWNEYTLPLNHETQNSFEEKFLEAFDFQYRTAKEITAVGVSCIGPLSSSNGIIINPPNFYGLKNINIFSILKDYHLPIYLENDMNTSAIAEKYFGYAKNIDNYIYVGVTKGIGSGIVANGRLYTGESGFSGEIGHITVDALGKTCSCGNTGCLELYIPPIKQWNDTNIQTICNYLGAALTTIANLFDPHAIYLGHEIANFNGIEHTLETLLNQRIITSKYKSIPVRMSKFGDNSPIYGAIAYAVEQILHQ